MRNRFFFAGLMFVFIRCGSPDFKSGESGDYDGKTIYNYYCTSCHGPNGDRGAGKASNLITSSMTDDEIRHMILFGSEKGMAAYQSILKEEAELQALVAYVKTLRN